MTKNASGYTLALMATDDGQYLFEGYNHSWGTSTYFRAVPCGGGFLITKRVYRGHGYKFVNTLRTEHDAILRAIEALSPPAK